MHRRLLTGELSLLPFPLLSAESALLSRAWSALQGWKYVPSRVCTYGTYPTASESPKAQKDVVHLAEEALVPPTSEEPDQPDQKKESKHRFNLAGNIPPSIAELILKEQPLAPRPPPPPLEPREYTPQSRRCGIIAVKAGMTQEWNEHGVRVPLTVLWVDDCEVTRIKHENIDNVTSLQLGAGSGKRKALDKAQVGEFMAHNVPWKAHLREFRVTEDAILPVGTKVTAAHFLAGQRVDVTGTSKGKGWEGVMQRWGFAGLPASHGVSKKHRSAGATGAGRNTPGKRWKGKKMGGRSGHEQQTMHHCLVYKVDTIRNLIYIRGQVPGPTGSYVYLRDNQRQKHELRKDLPFPTFLGSTLPGVMVAPAAQDPYRVYREDVDYFEERWKGSD